MGVGIGGGGFVGFAIETTPGTYLAPTKFVPVDSESLKFVQDTTWRRPIRQSVDVVGAVPGNARVEGDLNMEGLEDVIPYFLMCSRLTVVKSGSSPNFTYTATPSAVAVPVKTMSVTIVRNGVIFGYVGVIVSSYTFTVDDGMLKFNCSMIGQDEASQALPVPAWPTTTPFGAGQYNIQIPTATQVFDADGFEFQVDDNGEAQYRLKDTGRGAQFVQYGERSVQLSMERDFLTRTDYDAFKALTAQAITITATKGANNSVALNMTTAIKDSYELSLGGQGDLLRASITYQGPINTSGVPFTIVVKTQEDIT
jgi:hypothetical protein